MLELFLLFAQEPNPPPGGGGGRPPLLDLLPILFILILAIFLLYLPTRRRERQEREMRASLKKNDKVLTSGGIIGVISFINEKDNEVTLRLEEGKVKVLRTAIIQVLQPGEGPKQSTLEGGTQ